MLCASLHSAPRERKSFELIHNDLRSVMQMKHEANPLSIRMGWAFCDRVCACVSVCVCISYSQRDENGEELLLEKKEAPQLRSVALPGW